jgi:hypothetical protein
MEMEAEGDFASKIRTKTSLHLALRRFMIKYFAHTNFCNESVASALLAIRKRIRLPEIPSEQKRTRENETEDK